MLPWGSREEVGFVGRADELEAWTALLRGLPAAGATLVVIGEPGVGKSRLLRQLCRRADEQGLRVLHTSCREPLGTSAYLPFVEILAPLTRPGGPLAGEPPGDLRAALETVTGLWDPAPGSPRVDDRWVVAESVTRILGLLARPSGLVLAVDDAQWGDPESLGVLEYLARTVVAEPVLVLVTVRPDEGGDGLVSRLAGAPGCHVARLARLGAEQAASLVHLRLGDDAPAEVVGAVLTRAEGLPLAIEELVDDLLRAGAVARVRGTWEVRPERLGDATSPSLEASVRTRLRSIGHDALTVATAVALRDDDSTWDQVADITGLAADAAADGLRELAESGLLVSIGRGRHRYRHGLIREAVLQWAPPSLVRTVARRAAVLEDAGSRAEPGRLARAAALWTLAGESEPAARDLLAAARLWLSRGAVSTAANLARSAHAASGSGYRAAAAETLTDALTRSGLFAEALGFVDEALSVPDRLVEVHCRAARCLMETGDATGAASHLDDAERAGGPSAEVLGLRGTLAFEDCDLDAALRLGERAVEAGEESGDAGTLGSALLVQARILRAGDPADAGPALERVVRLAEAAGLASLQERGLLELGLLDRLTTNRADRLEEARRLADERGSVHTLAVADLNLWPVVAERGDLARAEELCRHGIVISERHQLRTLLPARAMLVLHEAMRGRLEVAAEQAQALRGTPFHAGGVLYVELFGGRPRAALDAVGPALDLDRSPDARAAPARGLHALLSAVLEDDPLPARNLLERGIGAWYNRGFARLGEAVVHGRQGRREPADRNSADGFADLAPFPTMAAIATTLVAQDAVTGGWGDPASWLTAARAHADLLGHRVLRDRCDALLRAAGLPVPRRGRGDTPVPPTLRRLGVTTREMDVLTLVADRLTNAQIADRLCLSTRTVDTHVSRLIAKAGVSGRDGLASLLD